MAAKGEAGASFERFEEALREMYAEYTFEYAASESGIDADELRAVAEVISTAGTRLATHNWRSAGAGNLGGWQVARTLTLLSALLGALATEGGTFPNAWNKFVPKPPRLPKRPPRRWNDVQWPREYPLALNEMSFLMPHLMRAQDAYLDVYFTRVHNPVWTNPDGFSWIEMLSDASRIGLHVAMTPTWNETAYFADYVLPMGHSSERHDLTSYEQYDGQWLGFRQPVLRAARDRLGEQIGDTREVNPGEVWEENEFWIELTWRIDPDGSLGIREFFESVENPGEKMTVDEYYGWIFANTVPGLPEVAAREGLTPLQYMRRYGAFEVATKVGKVFEQPVPDNEMEDAHVDEQGRVYTRAPVPASPQAHGGTALEPDEDGRRRVGVRVDGEMLRGWPTPSGKLEFWSNTLAEWGWPELAAPTYIKSHVHPSRLEAGQMPLISTFRIPVQIHTRSANSKWLDEIAHTNPLWIHPTDAARLGIGGTGSLVRVTTDLGYFVVKAWITEGIRPGVVACSHHMGRWKPEGQPGQRLGMMTVALAQNGSEWSLDAEAERRSVPLEGSRHDAGLVDRRWRASESDPRGAPGPGLRAALLAPGRTRDARRSRRPAWRRVGRHGWLAGAIRALVGTGAAGRQALAGWDAPALVDAASGEARARGLPVLGRLELARQNDLTWERGHPARIRREAPASRTFCRANCSSPR